ncbi:MAG: CerR family C-terminal domain-containing protein [Roseiarcus sp.]
MALSAKSSTPAGDARGETTRAALIRVGLDLFGAQGFEAASTRAIAAAAKTNVASIAYHFGGKEGLRLACADHVAATIRAALGPAAGDAADVARLTPEAARARLAQTIEAIIRFIVVSPAAQAIARFVLREQFESSAAFERFYAGAFAPLHERVCAIWAVATGAAADSVETRLATLAMLGQILYFRLARRVALRRMGWRDIGPAEAEEIRRVLIAHLDAAIAAARRARS